MTLPPEVAYGTVTWHGVRALDPDGDGLMNGGVPTGSVVFTASIPRVLSGGSVPPTTVFLDPVSAALDQNGSISQQLVATDDPSLSPSDWTWTVTFNIGNEKINPFSFSLPSGTTVDLTNVVPVASSVGTLTTAGPPGPTGSPGPVGPAGPASTLTIGTVTTGGDADAEVTGDAPNQTLNLTLPAGPTGATGPTGPTGAAGATGPANTLTVGTVTVGSTGDPAVVTITGAAPNQTINFTLPAGATGVAGPAGAAGATGPANTLTIGTVSTGAPGSSATAAITGTAPNQTLSLTIPRGNQGVDYIAGAGNLLLDPSFDQWGTGGFTQWGKAWDANCNRSQVQQPSSLDVNAACGTFSAASGGKMLLENLPIPVTSMQQYRVTVWAMSTANAAHMPTLEIDFLTTSTGVNPEYFGAGTTTTAAMTATTLTATWTLYTAYVTAPSGATLGRLGFQCLQAASGGAIGDQVFIDAATLAVAVAPSPYNGQPAGGATATVLAKQSGNDFDSAWVTPASLIADTGWIALTPASGYVAGSTPCRYRLRNGVVYLQGLIAPTSGNFTVSSTLLVANIPAGYRPGVTINCYLSGNSAANSMRAQLTAAGNLNIYTGATTGAYVDIGGIAPFIQEG